MEAVTVPRTLGSALLVALSCAALATWFAGRPTPDKTLALTPPSKVECPMPVQFKTGFQRDLNAVLPDGTGFAFKGVSWLEAKVCAAGVLKLQVQGQEAGGEVPRLYVSLNGQELEQVEAWNKLATVDVRVPQAGLLRLAYLNDYYRSEVRSATLEEIKLIDAPCTELTALHLPPNVSDRWATSTTFTSQATLTVQPCSAGQLQFKLIGRSGASSFPILSITQQNTVIMTLPGTASRQLVRVPVTAQPVSITLTNPYFKELADRNLFIRSWSFQPVSRSS